MMTQPRALTVLAGIFFAIEKPAILIVRAVGVDASWFTDEKTGGLAVVPFCLILVTNTFIGGILGTIASFLLECINPKKK